MQQLIFRIVTISIVLLSINFIISSLQHNVMVFREMTELLETAGHQHDDNHAESIRSIRQEVDEYEEESGNWLSSLIQFLQGDPED
jgi:hypothetical protein